jgi:hypothetical protein
MTRQPLVRWIAIASVVALLVFSVGLAAGQWLAVGIRSRGQYRFQDYRSVVLSKAGPILLDGKNHEAYRMGSHSWSFRLGVVLLWPRDSMLGVGLSDRVKLEDPRWSASWRDDGTVELHVVDANGNVEVMTVSSP